MEDRVIYYNYKKALLKILLGIGAIIAGISVIIIASILTKHIFIFVGGSIIIFGISTLFFAFKAFSRKPLFIFSDKGLFIGFNANRWIKRENIDSIIVKDKKVDNRLIEYIEISMRFNINAPSNRLVKEFPIENIKEDSGELYKIIREFMRNKTSNVVDSEINN